MIKYEKKERYKKPTNLKELLTLALIREKSSFGFYEDMAKHSFTLDTKVFLDKLKNEELGHILKIENKLKELGM